MTADTVSAVPRPPAPKSAAPEISGAEAVVRTLELLGVRDVFGLPGGAILPVYDPLMDAADLRHILVRHEQGAGHAAEGSHRRRARSVSASRPLAPVRPTS